MNGDIPQGQSDLHEVFNALRYLVCYGCALRGLPNDLPPWYAVEQEANR
jgi:transposase